MVGGGVGGYIWKAPNTRAGDPPGSYATLPASSPTSSPGPRSPGRGKAGGRSHPLRTGLSHPGDAETEEAEQHDREERDQPVHQLGPHGAGRVGRRAAGSKVGRGASSAPTRRGKQAGACAPTRPLRTLPTASLGPQRTREPLPFTSRGRLSTSSSKLGRASGG